MAKVNMPEKKKVTIAPGTKIKEDGKLKQKTNGTKRDGTQARNLNPIQRSKENIKRSYDVRRARENYGDKIKSIQDEQETDIRDLTEKINYYRKDNEKLIRQQVMKFGMTLEEMNDVKSELEHARETNDGLYHQVEARKEECDKLQVEMDNLVERINALALDKSDLMYEKKLYKEEKTRLEKTEFKIQELIKSNRQMRSILLHNKINPNTDASKITSTTLVKTASPKNETTRRMMNSEATDSRFPVIYNKRNLTRFRSMEDVAANQRTPKQVLLRRSRSYNNHHITPQEFFRRRQSDPRMYPTRYEVFI